MQPNTTFTDNFPKPQVETVHPLRFTGDGRTWYRFWIVNVLLAVVTMGLHKPLARRRTAQYFYEHTLVAGSPLEFTAKKRAMMIGFIIALILWALWHFGQSSERDAVWASTLVLAALWMPYALTGAMRFRLAHTRWRGLRLRFAAPWRTAYAAYWPLVALALLAVATLATLSALAPFELEGWFDIKGLFDALFTEDDELYVDAMYTVLAAALLGAFGLCVALDYNTRDLLIRHARFGAQPVGWRRPTFRTFAKIWFVAVLLLLLGLTLLDTGADLALQAVGIDTDKDDIDKVLDERMRKHGPIVIVWVLLAVAALWFSLVLATLPARAYYSARMFGLQWNRVVVYANEAAQARAATRVAASAAMTADDYAAGYADASAHINAADTGVLARFSCTLRARRFIALRFKNTLLRILTLGFYGPLATLSEYRAKVESVTLHVAGDIDELAGELVRQQTSVVGDALADVAGLELVG